MEKTSGLDVCWQIYPHIKEINDIFIQIILENRKGENTSLFLKLA